MSNKLELIVRVTKNRYLNKGVLVSSTKARVLKRKSTGDLSDLVCDPEYDLTELNLESYSEGLYRLTTTDHSFDIETGYLDGYRLILEPYNPEV